MSYLSAFGIPARQIQRGVENGMIVTDHPYY